MDGKKLVPAVVLLLAAAFARTAPAYVEILDPRPLEKETREELILRMTAKSLNRQYEETFAAAEKAAPASWFSVDIKAACTINIFSSAGETCPVNYPFMPTGKQTYYGVPLEIVAPADNANRTAIALPSNRLLPGKLAPTAEVPVGRTASVLYVLVSTYYTSNKGTQYFQMNYEDGSTERMKFIGTVHSGDWYHDTTRIHSEDVRYVLVPAAKDTKTFFRNMHLVQWKNPHPAKKIRSLTFASDPAADMGVFIVAVTGLP